MNIMIKLFTLITAEQSKHFKFIINIYVYINLTQLSYKIMFNSNKNLLFNYSYYMKNTVNILSLYI